MFRSCPLFFLLLVLLLDKGLGSSSVKPRSKRSYHHRHSTKLSIKDLALELAKKHLLKMIINEQHDLDKAKENVYVLQRDSCTYIKSIGKPVTHNTRYQTQGALMKDPLGIMGAETIFVMEYYSGNVLEEFENMAMFKAGIARKKYKLPYSWDGTGGVVYGPYLYYNRAGTNNVVKYNLRTEREEKQIGLSGSARKTHYQWGGNTQVDLAVDEHGLWAVWGYNGISNKLRVRMIDVYKGTLTHAWHLNSAAKMSSMGNAFVACGVIYCIGSYNSRTTTINYAFDTKTGRSWNPNIQFTNQFGYNSMVAYNPRERVLYAWDNKRLVTYPITFEKL